MSIINGDKLSVREFFDKIQACQMLKVTVALSQRSLFNPYIKISLRVEANIDHKLILTSLF